MIKGFLKLQPSPVRLVVNIISGQNIPKRKSVLVNILNEISDEVLDPCVNVRIDGHPEDTIATTEMKTRACENNAFNPIWNQVLPLTKSFDSV